MKLLAELTNDICLSFAFMNANRIPNLNLIGSNIDSTSIDCKEPVANQLTSLRSRSSETKPKNDIVKPHLKKLQ